MEMAIVAIAVVAVVAFAAIRGASSEGPPQPASQISAGVGGPALQSLLEQSASTPGTPGSGSLAPSGLMPPVASSPIQMAPRPPMRVPINMAPVQRVRFSAGAYPVSKPAVGFNGTNTASTGQGMPVTTRARVTFSQ